MGRGEPGIPADSEMPRWTMGCAAVMFLTLCVYITIMDGEPYFRLTLPIRFYGSYGIETFIYSIYEAAVPVAIFILAGTYVKKDLELMGLPLFFYMTGGLTQFLLTLINYNTWKSEAVWFLSRSLLLLSYLLLFIVFSSTASGKIKSRKPLVFTGFGLAALALVLTAAGTSPFSDGIFSYRFVGISMCLCYAALCAGYGCLGLALDDNPDSVYMKVGEVVEGGNQEIDPGRIPCELMQRKEIGVCLLLSLVTLKIYPYIWAYSIMKKIRLLGNRYTDCGGEMLCYLFVPFYKLYWFYTRGGEIADYAAFWGVRLKKRQGAYLLMSFFLSDIVVLCVMQSELNAFSRRIDEILERERLEGQGV